MCLHKTFTPIYPATYWISVHGYPTDASNSKCPKPLCPKPCRKQTFHMFPIIMNDITVHPVARSRTWEPSSISLFFFGLLPVSNSYLFYLWFISWIYPPSLHPHLHCYYHCDFLRKLGSNVFRLELVVYCLLPSSLSSDCDDSGFLTFRLIMPLSDHNSWMISHCLSRNFNLFQSQRPFMILPSFYLSSFIVYHLWQHILLY